MYIHMLAKSGIHHTSSLKDRDSDKIVNNSQYNPSIWPLSRGATPTPIIKGLHRVSGSQLHNPMC